MTQKTKYMVVAAGNNEYIIPTDKKDEWDEQVANHEVWIEKRNKWTIHRHPSWAVPIDEDWWDDDIR